MSVPILHPSSAVGGETRSAIYGANSDLVHCAQLLRPPTAPHDPDCHQTKYPRLPSCGNLEMWLNQNSKPLVAMATERPPAAPHPERPMPHAGANRPPCECWTRRLSSIQSSGLAQQKSGGLHTAHGVPMVRYNRRFLRASSANPLPEFRVS